MESHRSERETTPRPLRKITELDDCLEEDLPVPLPPTPWWVYLVYAGRHLVNAVSLTKLYVWATCRWPGLLRCSSATSLFLAFCLLSVACEELISRVQRRSRSSGRF